MTVSRGGRKIPPKDNSKDEYVSKEEFELQQKRTLESIEKIKEELIKNNRQVDTFNEQIRPLNSILKKIEMILDQLNNIAKQTNYNGTALLQESATNGAAKSALSFQIGESTADLIKTKTIKANVSGYSLVSLKGHVSNGAALTAGATAAAAGAFTRAFASAGQKAVDRAITVLNGYRGDIGSTQNQVESAVRNLMTQSTNIKNAESVLRDVDYAEESANFNKLNIISQAGSYAISQSNAVSQNVLRLLQ